MSDDGLVKLVCALRKCHQGRIDAANQFGDALDKLIMEVQGVRRSPWDRKLFVYHAGPLVQTAADLTEVLHRYATLPPTSQGQPPCGVGIFAWHADDSVGVSGPGSTCGNAVRDYIMGGIAKVYSVKVFKWNEQKQLGREIKVGDGVVEVTCIKYIEQLKQHYIDDMGVTSYKPSHVTTPEIMKLTPVPPPAEGSIQFDVYVRNQTICKALAASLGWAEDVHLQIKQPLRKIQQDIQFCGPLQLKMLRHIIMNVIHNPIGHRFNGKGIKSLVLKTLTPRPWDEQPEGGYYQICDASNQGKAMSAGIDLSLIHI